ncbi:MAG: DNA polymerase III subunit gamma/tau [Candidatus Zipacnadales bacterium]
MNSVSPEAVPPLMAYVSLTLKYRPNTFTDVVGQDHVTRTLRNAIASGRIHHAYLFCGPRGTGKTSVARLLGKALNCASGPTPDPCGECAACVAIREGRALDIVEIDAASNRGIDEIRDLREKVKYSPAEARHKLYILDEVHMLTTEAFNALLKTLEEPPAHAFFVLATTEPHRVPATIVSRCQRFDFRRLGVSEIVEALQVIAKKEGIVADREALTAIARAADGGMRDAQSILDQMRAYAEDKIDLETVNVVLGATDVQTLIEIVNGILKPDPPGLCKIVDRLLAEGKDLGQLLNDLMEYARDLSRLSLGCDPIGPAAGEESRAAIREQAKALGPERAMSLMTHFAQVRQAFRLFTQHGLLLETALLEAAQPTRTIPAASSFSPLVTPAAPARPPSQASAPVPSVPAGPRAQPVVPEVREITAGEPAPISPGRPLSIEVVRQHWPAVEGVLRNMGRYPVWALVQSAQPTAVEGNRVTLTFGSQWKVLHSKITGEHKQVLEQAVSTVLGCAVEIDAVLNEGEEAAGSADLGEAAEGAPEQVSARFNRSQPSSAVEQVKQAFPGSVVMGGEPRPP